MRNFLRTGAGSGVRGMLAGCDVTAALDQLALKATYLFEHVDGDRVMQCGRITGVAAETMLGIPTRHGELDFAVLAMIIFRDGEMNGEHIVHDLDDFCTQAGVDVQLVRAAAAELNAALNPAVS